MLHCQTDPQARTTLAIGHRGAPLGYPEHTRESYLAAAQQGAGIVECDVTFTRDLELVCRHAQCDLHTTTNILATPLAARCREPFTPADPVTGRAASARCCTSDLDLAEFRTLCGRSGRVDADATSVAGYLGPGPAGEGTDTGGDCGELLSHADSIALLDPLGVGMAPELKAAEVDMPFHGVTRTDLAARMLDEYRAAGVDPARVHAQSFYLDDIGYWIESHPEFGRQAVYLDARLDAGLGRPEAPERLEPAMAALAAAGVGIVAPPLWVLLTLDDDGRIVPSAYARAARAAGLDIMTWTLERSGDLSDGGGYYYRSVAPAIRSPGDVYRVLDVLVREIGVVGVFSDWPATVSRYANCAAQR